MPERIVVAKADDIAPGKSLKVVAKGRDLVVFNVSGEYFALFDRCPHEGAALSAGKVIGLAQSEMPGQYRLCRAGEFVRCPWHGWEFEIRTGQSYCGPNPYRVKKYEIAVEMGTDLVKGPYKAETVSVDVEGAYLVVNM
jgi:nitrite reductase/ring-hydroxylating ferredoxin subunit